VLGREAWLAAAKEALIEEGIGAVEIGKLARRLDATRGGFYWFFDSRDALLDELLAHWERTNTQAFKAVLKNTQQTGIEKFKAIADVWVTEASYSPAWDAAIRDWARVSKPVAQAMRRVDNERIGILKRLFLEMGCEAEEAFIRARIAYFHQVGYYALGVHESLGRRKRLVPLYIRYLTGR